MKKILAISFALICIAAGAQDEPTVDIFALSIGQGTILDFIAEQAEPVTSCDLGSIRGDTDSASVSETEEERLARSRFVCFHEALQATGLADTLSGEGPYTVFAPTDEAFADFAEDLGATTFAEALEDTERLTEILRYHVSPVELTLNDMRTGAEAGTFEVETLQGSSLELDFPFSDEVATVTISGETLAEGEAFVTGNTIDVDNGYIIPVGKVLIPPTLETSATQ